MPMESPLRPESQLDESSRSDIARTKEIAIGRLLERGIDVSDGASAEQLVQLLTAVEEFEAAASARACDSFTNTLESSAPDDPDCVLPRPLADEPIEAYTQRVRQRAQAL